MYKIAIVEDQTIIRAGLYAVLTQEPQFNVVSQSGDPIELFRQTWFVPPDLVLLDLIMPKMNGVEAIEEVKKRWHGTKVLVYTFKDAGASISDAFQAGADGYLLKNASTEELVSAVKNVLAGHYYVSDEILPTIMSRYLRAERMLSANHLQNLLTTRERELLKLITEGYKNKEMADSLCISLKTVETHRTNLMKKLNVHNVAELISVAGEAGITRSDNRSFNPVSFRQVQLAD
ncbi:MULTISPECIES: response regulator [unclassified Methylobacter]|uniref:response regulator n=1 Tax=unclassified Methylobacter TaxID=2635283 RepID=UPI0018942C7A|nr:response regulator transcription factor [Methylobacter sp. BlB1]MBF6649667.1 response regulator transcription factor [Methylobacter sp. BlB1]